MSLSDLLKEAEADLATLSGLPGEIQAKVRSGVAELTRIRDAVDGVISTLTGTAQATLAALQSVATPGAPVGVGTSPSAPADPAPPSAGIAGA